MEKRREDDDVKKKIKKEKKIDDTGVEGKNDQGLEEREEKV